MFNVCALNNLHMFILNPKTRNGNSVVCHKKWQWCVTRNGNGICHKNWIRLFTCVYNCVYYHLFTKINSFELIVFYSEKYVKKYLFVFIKFASLLHFIRWYINEFCFWHLKPILCKHLIYKVSHET